MKALSLLRVGLPLLLCQAALPAQTPAPSTSAKQPPAAKDATAKDAPAAAENDPAKKDDPAPAVPTGAPRLRGAEQLTEEQNRTLTAGINEVSNYIRGVRNLEALEKLGEMEQELGPNYYLENLRGAVYTKLRYFNKARVRFQKALDLAKGLDRESFHPRFNLAELDFVEAGNASAQLRETPPRPGVDPAVVAKQWSKAREGFSKLLEDPGRGESGNDPLINFKLFICNLMEKRNAQADVIQTTFDKFDEFSPAYYYAQAVLRFVEDDKEGAQGWMESARRIYSKEINEVYNDSLVELGWLETLQ